MMKMTRREFLKNALAAGAGTAAVASAMGASGTLIRDASSVVVAIVSDPADSVANSGPVRWAVEELCSSLAERQISVQRATKIEDARKEVPCVVITGSDQPQP